MAADSVIALVEDGSCLEQRFRRAEDLFHHPKLLVLQRNLGGGEIGVGAQHPLAIVTSFVAYFLFIDREALALGLEILAIALVADEGLVAP